MQSNKQFYQLNMMMIPRNERSLVHNDNIFISDNIDIDHKELILPKKFNTSDIISSSHPFKIEFSLFILCLKGEMDIRINMTKYKLCKSEVLIIPESTIGECNNISEDCRLIIIAFSKNYLNINITPQVKIIHQRFLSKSPIISLNNQDIEEFKAIYSNIKYNIKNDSETYKNEIIYNYIQILFYSYFRLMAKSEISDNGEKKNRKHIVFEQFMQILEVYHIKERKISFYADKLCLTPKYLSQVIFEVSGQHASEWIKDYVILEAKALLKSGQYSVQQVSDILNFANQSFFGVYFKKAVGCSPLSYQNMP